MLVGRLWSRALARVYPEAAEKAGRHAWFKDVDGRDTLISCDLRVRRKRTRRVVPVVDAEGERNDVPTPDGN